MNDLIKWAVRLSLHGVVWVYLLSIQIDGKAAFHYAHDMLVRNSLVEAIDGELAVLWQRVAQAVQSYEAKDAEQNRKTL